MLKILQSKKKIIVIKPRQIGVSTLLRAFAFWQTYVSVNPIKYGVLSFHDRSAKHLRKMDHNFLNGLPEMLNEVMENGNNESARVSAAKYIVESFRDRVLGFKKGKKEKVSDDMQKILKLVNK